MTAESIVPEMVHPWAIYLQASEEARRRGDRRTGTEHILLALLADPSIEAVLGVSGQQARLALESLDQQALGALGVGSGSQVPLLPMRAVPEKPTIRSVMTKDRRLTPMAKKVLEDAVKPMRRKTQVTAQQVLVQILALRSPDPAAVLLAALDVHTSEVRRRLDPGRPDL